MKSINLKEAYLLLQQAAAVDLEGRLIRPILHELDDDDDNVFLTLFWSEEHDGELLDFTLDFEEGDNLTCVLEGTSLILVSTDQEEEILEILVPLHYTW